MVSILIVTVGGIGVIKKLTAFIKDTVFEAILRKRGKVKDAIYAMFLPYVRFHVKCHNFSQIICEKSFQENNWDL